MRFGASSGTSELKSFTNINSGSNSNMFMQPQNQTSNLFNQTPTSNFMNTNMGGGWMGGQQQAFPNMQT
jgi:triacylglycerol esterase/lipase EstA (alpha/beta hydrolase family)